MLEPPPITLTDFMSLQGFKIDSDDDRKALMELCLARNYGLVIFDSLIDLHSRNENSAQDIQTIIAGFREFSKKGITVLICHHLRKENYLGLTTQHSF